jgi:hypothetical protein
VTREDDPAAIARTIIDSNLYVVLGTADQDGGPLGVARLLRARNI